MKFAKYLLLGLLMTAFIAITPTCKKSEDTGFNIVGSWDLSLISSDINETYITTFSGSETDGDWTMDMGGGDKIFGTYRVESDTVELTITYANFENGVVGTFNGKFENEDRLSGTFAIGDENPDLIGTWIAVRK